MNLFGKGVAVLLTAALLLSMLCFGASAAASDSFTVSSNLTDDIVCEYNSDKTQLTVTYYMQSDLQIVNAQGKITYDDTVLSLAEGTTKNTVMPYFYEEGSQLLLMKKSDGVYSFSASNVDLCDFTSKQVFFTVTFDIIGSGNSTVDLDVIFLTATSDPSDAVMENDVNLVYLSEVTEGNEIVFSFDSEAAVLPEDSGLVELSLTHSLALDGKIGVFFNYMLTDEILSADDVFVRFTCAGEATDFPLAYATLNTNGRYRFKLYVTAAQMADEITAQLYVNNEPYSTVDNYSVKKYADTVIASSSSAFDSVKPLVKAMLDYGGKTQLQFNYNTNNLANADLAASGYVADELTNEQISAIIDASADETYKANAGIDSFSNMTLVLDSDTTARIYLNVADTAKFLGSTFTCTVDGQEGVCNAEAPVLNTSDGRYVVRIPNIASAYLDKTFVLNIENGGGNYSVTFSPLTYVKKAQTAAGVSQTLKDVTAALYNYNKYAVVYFSAN